MEQFLNDAKENVFYEIQKLQKGEMTEREYYVIRNREEERIFKDTIPRIVIYCVERITEYGFNNAIELWEDHWKFEGTIKEYYQKMLYKIMVYKIDATYEEYVEWCEANPIEG